jgi:hypothetical protein
MPAGCALLLFCLALVVLIVVWGAATVVHVIFPVVAR